MGGVIYDGAGPRRSALILGADAGLAELVRNCGLTPLRPDNGSEWPLADLAIVNVRTDAAPPPFAVLRQYQKNSGTPVIAFADMPGLDMAYAALAGADAHWLVDGSDVDALAMIALLAYRPKSHGLREERDLPDYAALHRISEDLADFAQLLAGMADRRSHSKTPFPLHKTVPPLATPLDPARIREMIRLRRLRDSYFEPSLFGEPAWDILLDLMAARLERVDVSVSSLCIAAAVPPTTALRCITAMTQSGMLERKPDPHDARRIFITLSPASEAAMRSYLAEALG